MHRKMSEQKLNIEFVKEVENFPCIYDYRRADYARKEVIDKAWAKIGTKFNLSGPQCRERWKNLRTVLSRNLKPNEQNGKSRSSKQQRKPYYLFEAMKFAVPFIKSHNTVPTYFLPKESNSASDADEKSEENEDNDEETTETICHVKVETTYDQSRSPSPYASPPPSPQVNLLEAPSPICVSPPPPPPPPQMRPQRKCKTKTKYSEMADVDTDENVPKHVKSKKPKNLIKKKPDLTKISKKRFLLSLLSDVYSMDNTQMRSFRIKILNVINEITQTPSSPVCTCNAATSNQDPGQSVWHQSFNGGPTKSLQNKTSIEGISKSLQNKICNPGLEESHQSPASSMETVKICQNPDSMSILPPTVVVKIEKDD